MLQTAAAPEPGKYKQANSCNNSNYNSKAFQPLTWPPGVMSFVPNDAGTKAKGVQKGTKATFLSVNTILVAAA